MKHTVIAILDKYGSTTLQGYDAAVLYTTVRTLSGAAVPTPNLMDARRGNSIPQH
jgi:hypothetical protein